HINLTGDYLWRSSAKIGAGKFRPLRPLAAAPRSARASSGRYDRCNRLSVLYFPFSEATPKRTDRS
ncbi:hypothetical protein, partial [Pseudomonas aeruginosa]|uniref:hypothetical protein n=1 Tax=Pseudomonas aeruginosa TaxID=287 RepID=UPI0029C04BED